MATKGKTTTAIVAGVTAAALLMGGTFAWTSIQQEALNESAGIVNVGGRLHDDFNGENKDVYVENFTDPLNGGQPIYARVRLDEYMEVGQDAGGIDDGDGVDEAVPVVDGTSRTDVTTWTTHIPSESCEVCANGETCLFHEHWTWTMGGSTVFMPTFNKDKDSLAADINGTYAGTNPDDKIYYDNYVEYVTADGAIVDVSKNTVDDAVVTIPEGATDANALTEANKAVTSVTDIAYYDDDTDIEDNDGTRQETETHTAKETATATVMPMQQWIDEGRQPGNFWVYDTDGWAYWANPIMPGEATGLLLDGIKMDKNPGEKCYYSINVVAQFATVGDWENFYTDPNTKDYDVSENAQAVLEAASQAVPTVTVTNVSGATTVEQGAQYNFTANVSKGAVANASVEANGFEWTVYDENMVESETSTVAVNADGGVTLTVGESEQSKALIIAARCIAPEYLGATGLSSVAVNVVSVPVYEIVLSSADATYPAASLSLQPGTDYSASLLSNGVAVEDINYTVKGVETTYQNDTIMQMSDADAIFSDYVYFTNEVLTIDKAIGANGTFAIIEISAADVAGNSLATRRFIVSESGVSVFFGLLDSEGQGHAPNESDPWLRVGDYSCVLVICDNDMGNWLNAPNAEYLTIDDLGVEEISEIYAAFVTVDSETGETVYADADEYISASDDLTTLTAKQEYRGEDLVLIAKNADGSVNYEQSIKIDLWNPIEITVTNDGDTVEPSFYSADETLVGANYNIKNYENETYIITFNRAVKWDSAYEKNYATATLSEDGKTITVVFKGETLDGVTASRPDERSTRLILSDIETGDSVLINFVDTVLDDSTN